MRIISCIEEKSVIEKILRHCNLWKTTEPSPPSVSNLVPPVDTDGQTLDYSFFEKNCG
jgi:hypothetical protein